jgi:hypothetical protein
MPTTIVNTEGDRQVLTAARVACNLPAKFGHSDIGDTLVRYLQGRIWCDDALAEIDCFIADIKREAGR